MTPRLLLASSLFLVGCTPGQIAGTGMMAGGGMMVIGGFTTQTPCTRDRPCYEGNAQPITSGAELSRPRSVPVGVVGVALVAAGAVVLIASTAAKPKAAASNTAPAR